MIKYCIFKASFKKTLCTCCVQMYLKELKVVFHEPCNCAQLLTEQSLVFTFLPIAPFCFFGGGGSNILCCCCGGRVEYNGMIFMSPTSGPKSSISRFILLQASSISCKTKKNWLEENWMKKDAYLERL